MINTTLSSWSIQIYTQSSPAHSNSSSLVGNSDNGSTQAFRLPSPLVLQALTLQSIFSVVLVMSRLLQLVSPPSSLIFVTSIWIEICLVSSLFGAWRQGGEDLSAFMSIHYLSLSIMLYHLWTSLSLMWCWWWTLSMWCYVWTFISWQDIYVWAM